MTPRLRISTVGRTGATIALLLLAACGGGSTNESDDLPTLADDTTALVADAASSEPTPDTSDPATSGTDSAAEPASDEDALLGVARCMRDEGIDFPDPVTNSDGSVALDFQGMVANGVDPQSDSFTAAFEACQHFADGVTLGGGPRGDDTETQDSLIALADCMRSNGVADFPDPDFSQATPGSPFGDIDLTDPQISATFEQCRLDVNLPEFGGAQP